MNRDRGTRLAGDGAPSARVGALDRRTLRFRDRDLEAAYRADHLDRTIVNIRVAFLGATFLWILWGVVLRGFLLPSDRSFDLILRYGVFIPLVVLGFAISFTPVFRRIWEWVLLTVIAGTIVTWIFYVAEVTTMPAEYGYVGLILISAFTYTLVRLRFVWVVLTTILAISLYVPYAVSAVAIFGVKTALATLFLTSFGALGAVAAYRLELSNRLLFLREREVEQERERSDSLLLNILPQVIVNRLKVLGNDGRVAEQLDDVSVVFADAVDSTAHAARSSPAAFAETLDQLFRRFDDVADRYGLEKIKTIGDAYMAVAGAPVAIEDHEAKAAEAALDFLEAAREVRWPTGDPVVMRVGLATGPAVAGVIGQRKFAYDLWGDTVNLASRLSETHGVAGRIQVTEDVAGRLDDRFELGDPLVVDLKGKGPTTVRFLLGRRSSRDEGAGRRSMAGGTTLGRRVASSGG